ncbi:hypothetical protein FB451DRAFT_84769 [Mycena latifolia]|nr:hypothetical protein FB451DRAFT_84769 [Mycena latifolia]
MGSMDPPCSKLSNDPELSTKSRNYTDCDDVVNRVNLIAPGGNYTLEQFFSANPEIKPKCTNLVQDYDYCVNAIRPADSESFPPIPQTTIGDPSFLTNPNCSEYRPLAANDTCDALGAQYKFNEDQLIFLNPQTSCSSLTPGEFVCVRPLSVMVYPAGMSAYISRLPFVNNDGLTTPNSLSFVPGIPSATSTLLNVVA